MSSEVRLANPTNTYTNYRTVSNLRESLQYAGRHLPLPWNPTDLESQNSSE